MPSLKKRNIYHILCNFVILNCSIIILFFLFFSEDYDTDISEDCCDDGTEWAKNTGKCEPPEDPERTAVCLNTALPCCNKYLE